MKIISSVAFFAVTCLVTLFTTTNIVMAQKTGASNYDEASKIFYELRHDDETLHINLKTTNPQTIMRMVRNGLTVFLDANGKKSHQVFLQYPMPQSRNAGGARERPTDGQRPKFSLSDVVERANTMALFSNAGVENKFFAISPTIDISVALSTQEDSILVYDLYIPFSLIKDGGLSSISKFSIGIEPGKFEMPANNPGGAGGATGARPGAARPRIGGSMSGAVPMDTADREAELIFWIPLELLKN